jgi:hypothetical protein
MSARAFSSVHRFQQPEHFLFRHRPVDHSHVCEFACNRATISPSSSRGTPASRRVFGTSNCAMNSAVRSAQASAAALGLSGSKGIL